MHLDIFSKINIIFHSISTITLGNYNLQVENLTPRGDIISAENITLNINDVLVKDVCRLKHMELLLPSIQYEIKNPLAFIHSLKASPPRILSLVASLSVGFLNHLAGNKDFLKDIEEIEEVRFNIKNKKFQVIGKAKKILTIPFVTIVGVYVLPGGKKIKINVEKVQVLNFLPVPGIGLSLVMNIMSKKLALPFIQQDGTAFIVDTSKLLPFPLEMNVKAIEMDDETKKIIVTIQGDVTTESLQDESPY